MLSVCETGVTTKRARCCGTRSAAISPGLAPSRRRRRARRARGRGRAPAPCRARPRARSRPCCAGRAAAPPRRRRASAPRPGRPGSPPGQELDRQAHDPLPEPEPARDRRPVKDRDVESLALLGRKDEALALLREAVDAGWRSTWPRHGWNVANDPYLENLRNDARFREIVAETDADLARMRKRAAQTEASGDWQPLLALAAHGEGRVVPDKDD